MKPGISVGAIEAVPLFAGLDREAIDAVAASARWERRVEGEDLVEQGESADQVYVVAHGAATVTIDGQPIAPGIGPGDCVGELAVLDDAPRAATVTTSAVTALLVFDAADFRDIVQQCPELRARLTRALGQRLRQVSSGWIRLAADTDLLLDAYLEVQDDDGADRSEIVHRAATLLRQLTAAAATVDPALPTSTALDALTPAERRVADLVAEGLSNATIAERLFVSRHTVESHLKHIFTKLDINSRVNLASLVLRPG